MAAADPGALRVAVLGDSLSAGVGDPDPALPALAGLLGRLHGWPHHLAESARSLGTSLDVHVLAVNGARTGAVRQRQLASALALAPDVATCFTGVNDVFDPAFSVDRFAADYRAVVEELAGAVRHGVVTLALHDVGRGLPVRAAAKQRLRARVAAANEVVVDVARATGAWLIGPERISRDLRGEGLLAVDRLHPNRTGHRRVAQEVALVLQAHGLLPDRPLPVPQPPGGLDGARQRLAADASHLLWMARFAPGPVIRGRAVPALLRRGPQAGARA